MNLELARPWVLLLLPLAGLALWSWRRRIRPAIAWPAAEELASLSSKHIEWNRLALRAIACVAAILALAGPRRPVPGDRLESEGIAIMLIVDVSGSMAEKDIERNGDKISRLDAIKSAFDDLIARRPQDRIGLTLFGSLPDSACPLTLDHAALRRVLAAAQPRGIPTENETNIGDAIAWGLDRLRGDSGRKVMILCSDGEHNVPAPALLPKQAAQLAAAAKVPIYAIDAGPLKGEGGASLEAVAMITGGQNFAAYDSPSLAAACDLIDRFEKNLVQDSRYRHYASLDQPLILTALVMLTLALFMDLGPWLRVP